MKCLFWVFLLATAPAIHAGEARIAVASNFLRTLYELAPLFEKRTGHYIVISPGSTGKLYAQIRQGAPYDVFLAADAKHPQLLEEEGLAVPGSRRSYAIGRLVLWSADPQRVRHGAQSLQSTEVRHIAIANPNTAPYGRATQQALEVLGMWGAVRSKLVWGEDVGQAFQFVATRNADLGFVSLAQLRNPNNKLAGSYWEVPAKLYDPIIQEMVLLKTGQDDPAARAFVTFMQTSQAQQIIERYGYGLR